ncbi:helix-hairpin-helix domain-containing protein [Enterococcus termitis]|uniref:ComEA protein n=1 Tax=Enterococcus termitis TaxID=332950 RepID=A0A1E5GZI7_9ENTE|nr:helix-hairpin-helix domain-containing protein [Enterococcus termitis]OEG17985.1 comEA protein [Enterococcus termitis]
MNYQELFKKYNYYLLGAGLMVIVFSIVVFIYLNRSSETIDEALQLESTSPSSLESSSVFDEPKQLYVDIKGAVKRPGMYEVKENMRVWDAILLADGVEEEADTKQVNFAEQVTDQMVIYVPKKGEEPLVKQELNSEERDEADTKINLNQADENQLQTLPGIGQKKAQEIIRYREDNGGFKSIEDIKNISGFGEKTFEKLKESITVS